MTLEYETRQDMIQTLSLYGHVVEVGVFKGDFAEDILRLCPNIDKLTLVDMWAPGTIGSGNQDGNDYEVYDGEFLYDVVVNKFKGNPKVDVVKSLSTVFLQSISDDSIDAIYIDADHSYEGCKNDLMLAQKKVKKGGWIMGHDFAITSKCKTSWEFGVNQAVTEFCAETGNTIHAFGMDGCVSFAIKKQ